MTSHKQHLSILLHRLSGLIRTRVILSMIGLYVMYKQPSIAQWVFSIIGLALGVSAIDAYRGHGMPKGNDSE